ncbi:unnamed protein product [Closterium sp. NIES-54]
MQCPGVESHHSQVAATVRPSQLPAGHLPPPSSTHTPSTSTHLLFPLKAHVWNHITPGLLQRFGPHNSLPAICPRRLLVLNARAQPRQPLCPTVTSAPTTAATATATTATAAPTYYTAMALLRVLAFDHEGRPVQFDTWLDDLQLYLLSDSKDSVSLFDLASGAATAPPATADSSTRSQWLTRDAAARLAIRNHLPLAECAHFGQYKTAQALYDVVVARYSSPATAALGRLLLPYLFPELSAFATVEDLFSHLRASDARYRAAVPAEDHFLSLDPTSLTVDLLEQHLLAAETSAVAVGAARGTPRPPFFEGCPPSPLAPSYASAAAAHVSVPEDVGVASASAKRRSSKGKGGRGGGGGSGGGGDGSGSGGRGSSGGGGGGGSGGGRTLRCASAQPLARASLPETSPTLRWMGEVGDASVFRVWGSRAFVCDTSVDKLSPRAIPCVTFDESVPFYRLFPYSSNPPPPPPLFLAPGLPPVAVGSGAARGADSGGVESGGAEPGGAASEGAEIGGAEPGGVGTGGAEPGGAEPEGVEPGGAASEGAESGGAEPQGASSSGGSAGASPRLSLQQLSTGARGVGVAARASGAGGAAATSLGGARTRGTGVAETGGVEGTGVVGPSAGGAGAAGAGVGCTGAGGTRAVDPCARGAGGTVRPRPYFVPLLQQVLGTPSSTGLTPPLLSPPPDQTQPPLKPASPLRAPSPYTEQSGGLTERRDPASCPVSPVRTTSRAPRSRPPPVPGTHAMILRPSSVPLRVPLPAPTESSLPEVPDPASDRARAASPTVSRLLATAITDPTFESAAASALVAGLLDFAAACRLNYATALVAESASAAPPSVGGECALGTDVLEDWQEDFESLTAAAAMDAKMASWKSTGTHVDEVPPPGANIVDGMLILRVKWSPGSPPAFKARYVARGFSQRHGVDHFQTFSPTPKMTTLRMLLHVAAQRDYELPSLDFSTAFLQGSLHKEIWLCRPPGFTGTFPAGTHWSLRWSVNGLRQAPRECHDTMRTTLAALGFASATADPSLFLRTDTSLLPFYIVVYVDDLVFATSDIEALTLVKSEQQKRHTCTDLGELRGYFGLQITRDRARRTITLTQSHMVHQVLQRFGFHFSLPQPTSLSTSSSLSAPPSDESVEPSGVRIWNE